MKPERASGLGQPYSPSLKTIQQPCARSLQLSFSLSHVSKDFSHPNRKDSLPGLLVSIMAGRSRPPSVSTLPGNSKMRQATISKKLKVREGACLQAGARREMKGWAEPQSPPTGPYSAPLMPSGSFLKGGFGIEQRHHHPRSYLSGSVSIILLLP